MSQARNVDSAKQQSDMECGSKAFNPRPRDSESEIMMEFTHSEVRFTTRRSALQVGRFVYWGSFFAEIMLANSPDFRKN